MECAEARRLLLEADPSELIPSPGATGELARHLRSCDACRRAAERIGSLERGLGDWLDAQRPCGDDAAALARAASLARRRAAARRVAWRAAPVLAAAAVVALLLVPREAPPPPRLPMPVAPAAPAPGFSVTAPPGRDLVVLHTQNPKIVVVWYVPSRRSS